MNPPVDEMRIDRKIIDDLYSEKRRLEEEVRRLREALERYGVHDPGCGYPDRSPCGCGLHRVLGEKP